MSEYSDAFLDRIYRMDRINFHPVNPVQNKYSDMLLANNIVKENNISDLYLYIQTDELCNNIIENTIGSGDRPIKYFNTSINLQNEVLSQLILCNADNSNINNVTIEGSATQRNNVGLEVIGTDNSNFSNINSSNNYYGIYLTYSNSNNLANNTANSNRYIGINLYNSSSNNLTNNTANSNSRPGIYLTDSNSNYLTNNTANSNIETGIYLSNSNSNNLTNNTAKYDISIGISIVNSDNNILTNNIGNSNGRFGFNIRSSNDNTLINNIADSNIGNGIRLNYSNMNIIIGNIANLNNESGINITSSNGNVIYNNYLNNFFNYHFDMISRNTWNTNQTPGINIIGGPYLGGNFWASPDGIGFSQTCTDADRDGICDSPFPLNSNNTDYLPLAAPDAPSVPSEIHGKVFNDINGDGIIDAGEAGISGVEIHFTRMISPGIEFLAGIISTDLNGNYSLTGISSGYYRIEEFPEDSMQTYPANGMPQFVTLGVGEIKNVENFGNQIILPGEIHGNTFNDSNGNGVRDTGESETSGVNICLYPSWRCTTTDSSGNYSFMDVSPGTYNVYEYLPSGFVATTTTIVTIAVNSGEVVAINFGNRLPIPPPSDISVAQQSGEQNGVPTVFRPSLTVLTISKNLTNISENVISVNLTMNWSDGTTRTANMVEIGNTNVWTADFSAPFPGGTAQMRFEVDVSPAGPGPEDAIQIGDIIFIDPSGQIKDACSGNSISDATVTLLVEYPLGTGNFIESPPENQIPEDNPLITGDDGRYSWLTIPGTYKVRADKAGYEIAQSDPVTVPPPVTDLNISMIPIGGCVPSDITAPDSVTNLNNITYASTYINWTWTDPANVDFARVKVYLNGIYKDDVLKGVQYYNATVEPGTHTIGTRTVDTSGNINSTMKTHTATTILPSVRYINGTVMDSITKEVLPGVKVSTTGASTTSNISGFYSLPVASGTYPITATYDIRYYANNSVTVSTALYAVVTQNIELVMKPTGNITGNVTKAWWC